MIFQFFIVETQCELYCRDLLFMSLFLESPNRMGLQGELSVMSYLCKSFVTCILVGWSNRWLHPVKTITVWPRNLSISAKREEERVKDRNLPIPLTGEDVPENRFCEIILIVVFKYLSKTTSMCLLTMSVGTLNVYK